MKIIQNSGTVMQFLDQNLKIKNDEQLEHRNIMNEILWIYGIMLSQLSDRVNYLLSFDL